MKRICSECQIDFSAVDGDLQLRSKLSPVIGQRKYEIPPPTLCPDCRQRRRLVFRNERFLYRRKCDASGKNIVSMYSEDKPFPVYSASRWWSDDWNAMDYGREYDSSTSFFFQLHKLLQVVPALALMVRHAENCDYNNEMADCKNCYMCFTTFWGEDFLYCYWTGWGRDCVDCSFSLENELCYECLDCSKCYNGFFLEQCKNVRDSYFLFDCLGCSDCFCSAGLRQKKYYFLNQPLSKDDYCKKLKSVLPLSHNTIEQYQEKLEQFKLKLPRKHLHVSNSENCVADYANNSKDCYCCFDVIDGRDMRYCFDVGLGADFMDVTQAGPCEMLYEFQSGLKSYNCAFCNFVWNSNDCFYCDHCFDCQDCFGCVGLRHKQHCVLNRQYSKEDYAKAAGAIIRQMQQVREWGEFFPVQLSPFAYNETVANQYYPLTNAESEKLGMAWREEKKSTPGAVLDSSQIPQTIAGTDDSILDQTLLCQVTGKAFKIVKQELKFYRKTRLPIPRKCPDRRHAERFARRNPRKLWKRNCGCCNTDIYSTYNPDCSEIVYCEPCYLEAVY
jgi:hypothetical protein